MVNQKEIKQIDLNDDKFGKEENQEKEGEEQINFNYNSKNDDTLEEAEAIYSFNYNDLNEIFEKSGLNDSLSKIESFDELNNDTDSDQKENEKQEKDQENSLINLEEDEEEILHLISSISEYLRTSFHQPINPTDVVKIIEEEEDELKRSEQQNINEKVPIINVTLDISSSSEETGDNIELKKLEIIESDNSKKESSESCKNIDKNNNNYLEQNNFLRQNNYKQNEMNSIRKFKSDHSMNSRQKEEAMSLIKSFILSQKKFEYYNNIETDLSAMGFNSMRSCTESSSSTASDLKEWYSANSVIELTNKYIEFVEQINTDKIESTNNLQNKVNNENKETISKTSSDEFSPNELKNYLLIKAYLVSLDQSYEIHLKNSNNSMPEVTIILILYLLITIKYW
jgi:hypothetical protein